MKYSLLPALALSGLVYAAPFNGQGVPSATSAVIHVDMDAAGESKLVQTLIELGESAAAAKPNSASDSQAAFNRMKAELGVDSKSVRDFTVSVFPPAAPGGEPEVALRLRGAFDRAKFEAIAKKHPEVTPRKSGKYTWYTAADLNKAFEGKSNANTDKGCVCMLNDTTVIMTSQESRLAQSIAAVEGKSTYVLDAEASSLFAGKPMLAGYFPESFVKAAQPASGAAPGGKSKSAMKSMALTLNDSAGKLNLHAATKFDSAAGAAEVNAQASMMTGMFGMMLGQEKPEDTAAEKADKQFAVSALQALKFAANGDTFNTDFSYSSDALTAKLMERKQDILDAVAKQASAGVTPGGSSKPVAKRPAKSKRPAPAPVVAE